MRVGYKEQISPQLKVWNRDQCHKMHLKSLEILERTGIEVHDDEAREIYKKGGAKIDGKRVRIPSYMVKRSLKSAPNRIVLSGTGERKLQLDENMVYYGLGTDLPHFQDYLTGEYRKTLYQDIVNSTKVTDFLANIDFAASLGIASDVTTKLADLYHMKAMLENTTKPILTTATDRENLQGMIDMAAAAVGGYDELKLDPVFLLYTEPISPLKNSPEAHQKLILAAECEIPVTYAAGISSGATGPVTIAGNLAVGNAECLAGLVLHQLVNSGAPFMYGIVAAPLDLKTTIACYGGPEVPLNFCVVGEMGRYYGLPTFGQAGNTDSGTVDLQASIDAAFSILVAAQSGTNLVHDVGYIGNGMVGSLEMLVLCDECIGMTKRFMKGIDLSQESLAVDLIDEIGPGGNYLESEHTLNNFKNEYWFPEYFNRKSFNPGQNSNRETVKNKIKEKIKDILSKKESSILSDNIREKINDIIDEYEEKIAD